MQIGGESKKNYDNNIFKKEFEVVGNHTLWKEFMIVYIKNGNICNHGESLGFVPWQAHPPPTHHQHHSPHYSWVKAHWGATTMAHYESPFWK
jgi:hypothetical protein